MCVEGSIGCAVEYRGMVRIAVGVVGKRDGSVMCAWVVCACIVVRIVTCFVGFLGSVFW